MVCAHFDLAVAHATTLYRRAVFAWANELVALILAIIIIIPITTHLIIISFHLVKIGKVIHARPITGPTSFPAIISTLTRVGLNTPLPCPVDFLWLHLNLLAQGVRLIEVGVGVRIWFVVHTYNIPQNEHLSRACE
jgi:hypothetical protein